ncbi:hypothetical protein Kpol_1018p159 [Vanderwaltozyma polyspora DSM 70294]|uniref:ATP-dependent DNA helicase II subunit 2 n=1 Tax=Vanderwaltozyma polyspora (strain ATCC 22028 / DSM 70294 / BCRC 21397 / CBS 2163 / NBRC 10782 / NRRL Y-8283 / UCD 57-17) TaxID=436907 RepID=A7TE00_VANPO|nr:uncharacterized protein Kpol_1018p159 [Vanderwaltozyma polyspora DSM 70294]EDO19620.1 hypothetical protein Kpol_1018p159 [Vanderwaltozyma polyspora DSM 70294]
MGSEATVFIIDVSPSMVLHHNVSKAMAYLEYTLLAKVKKARKTDYISCFLGNSPVTANSQDIPNVFEVKPFIAPITSSDVIGLVSIINKVKNQISGSSDETLEDDISSMVQCLLVTSLNMKEYFNKRKLLRQIVIFTDDIDGLDLTDEEMEVFVEELDARIIFIDCRETKLAPIDESRWGKLLGLLPGSSIYDIHSLLEEISLPKAAIVKPVRVFSGKLRLGADIIEQMSHKDIIRSETRDENSIAIKVEGFPATKAVTSLSRKNVIKEELDTDKGGRINYIPTKSVVEYEIEPIGDSKEDKKEGEESKKLVSVSANSISKAYRYGTDYVVLPSSISDERFYKTSPGIDIRGFLDKDLLPRYYLSSESRVIFADTKMGTLADVVSMGAFVDVMIENDKVAIVRYVQKPNSEVEMCALIPHIFKQNIGDESEDLRVFILNRLPFAEDERVSDFPKLTERYSTSGKKLHTNIEKKKKIDSMMSNFVDDMDMDAIPSVPTKEYYSSIGETAKDTTLFFPEERDNKSKDNDPMIVPAIDIHFQKQVLLEWIHQKLINHNETFETPMISETLERKILPIELNETGKSNVTDLLSLLQLKVVDEKETSTTQTILTQREVKPIPPLEELLAKGKRD